MAFLPEEPFRQLQNMRHELDRFFSTRFPNGFFAENPSFGLPQVDVFETETEVIAACDIPGLEKKEDLTLSVDNQTLTIRGEINRENETKQDRMHRRERFVGRFQRSGSPSRPGIFGRCKSEL